VRDLSREVREALASPDTVTSIRGIKSAAQRLLHAADPTAQVLDTNYFNHTFSPDFMLRWSRDSNGDRPVYLRFTDDLAELAADVDRLQARHPLMIGLERLPEGGEEHLSQHATRAHALVTDSASLASLEDERNSEPVVGVLSTSIMQGGHGVLSERETLSAAGSFIDGFRAVTTHERSAASGAIQSVERILDPDTSARLSGFLAALWVASGGMTTDFPGRTTDLHRVLPTEALSILLQIPDVTEDVEFWRRLGHSLSLKDVESLRVSGHVRAFNRLVAANVDRLFARALCVGDAQLSLDMAQAIDLPVLYWTLEDGLLTLKGETFTAQLASTLDEIREAQRAGGENTEGISLNLLRSRAQRSGLAIGELTLVSGTRLIGYSTQAEDDVMKDPQLRTLEESLRPTFVRRAAARVPRHGPLFIDFSARIASGRTSAQYQISDLMVAGLGLLADLSEREAQVFDEVVPPAPQTSLDFSSDV
jgi:hypothetical protein